MPHRPFLAPRVWTRPRCAIYNDNYRFGNAIITGGLDGVERKYHEAMARADFKSENRSIDPMIDSSFTSTPSTGLSRSMSVSRVRSSSALSNMVDSNSFERSSLRRRSTRRRAEALDAVVSAPASASVEAHSQLIYLDRCRELTSEIERLNSTLLDTETRLKQESASVKNRLATEVQQLQQSLDDQTRVGDELRAAVKRQGRQVLELQSHLEHMERAYQGALEELQAIQRKALAVCNEVDTMRSSLDRV